MLSNVLELCKVDLSSESVENVLVFKDLTRDMFKDNTKILNKYFRNSSGKNCAYANLLQIKQELGNCTLYKLKKILNKDFNCKVSLKGYKYDPKHYVYGNVYDQLEYEEDYYRTPEFEEERRLELSNQICEGLDYENLEILEQLVIKSIKTRTLMLFQLENVLPMLNTAIEADLTGFNCSGYNYQICKYLSDIKALLENKEVISWLKQGKSDLIYTDDESTCKDYIKVYNKCLKLVFGEYLAFMSSKDIFNVENKFDIEIMSELDNVDECSYYEDNFEEEDEYYLD